MKIVKKNAAGFVVLFGAAQFLLAMIVAEALYGGYSTNENWISDLGVGGTSLLFNSSIILFGICGLGGAYFLNQEKKYKILPIAMAIASIGAVGVGIFPENALGWHYLFSVMTLSFLGICSIVSFFSVKTHLFPRGFWLMLGIISVLALISLFFGNYLGLGPGGIERLVVYPGLIWLLSFGGYLAAKEEK